MKTIEVGMYKSWQDANTVKDILKDKSCYRFESRIIEAPNGLIVVASTYLEAKKKHMTKPFGYEYHKIYGQVLP
jgi:hypothetical protein